MNLANVSKEHDGSSRIDDSRRIKKRELDRRCQRATRDRIKAHIVHLEKLVQDFKSQDSTGHISLLVEQISSAKKERDESARVLVSITNLIQPCQYDLVKSNASVNDNGPSSSTIAHIAAGRQQSIARDDSRDLELDSTTTAMCSGLSSASGLPENNIPFEEALKPVVTNLRDCSTSECSTLISRQALDKESINLWQHGNDVLMQATTPRSRGQIAQMDKLLDDDVPIRAALEGWKSLEHICSVNKNWQSIRQFDEHVLIHSQPLEKLATTYLLNTLIRAIADPGEEGLKQLPRWYQPKYVSRTSVLIDY